MEAFLAASRKCLANLGHYQRVRVILGNPTCDLDSAVCALAQGYLEYMEAEEKFCTCKDKTTATLGVIPVLNVTKDEFRVKTEVIYYLRRCNVPRDLLTFRNEIDLQKLQCSGKLELVLVDHHVLPSEDTILVDSVVEIIDHRPQDTNWPWTGRKLNLSLEGSCATLVASNILERRPDTIQTVASLLQGPILVDTANFSKDADRATPVDCEIMAELERVSGTSAANRTKLFQDIQAAKSDISELTPSDLLIRDLKVVNGIPMPGFPILVKDFLELEGAVEALEAFCEQRNCRLAVLIGLDLKKDIVTRDIAVYSSGPDQAANKLIEALTKSTSPNLQLAEVKRTQQQQNDVVDSSSSGVGSSEKLLVLYKQANLRASRKQILPIIQSALSA